MHISNLKLKALSAMVAAGMMAAAGAASAQNVTGAGATLPQPLYEDIFSASGANGVLGAWSYAGGGSGSGKSRFLTATNTVNFAGSDSALTDTDIDTTYAPNAANWGPLIQIPAVLTSVTLPYTAPAGTTLPELNLTREQVCDVFSGNATTWGELLTPSNPGSNTNAIRVVYRTESSGTTELLSNFLVSACDGYGFQKSNSFSTVVADTGAPISNWVGVSGSSGVKSAVATAGSIGYLSPDYQILPTNPKAVAKIDGALPSAVTFPSSATPPVGADRRNPLNWIPDYVLPTDSAVYPIYGTTNLLVGQCYASGFGTNSIGAAIKDFVTKLNTGAYDTKITKHYFVKLPTAWNTAINEAFIAGTDGNGLSFGDSSICNGISGRPS